MRALMDLSNFRTHCSNSKYWISPCGRIALVAYESIEIIAIYTNPRFERIVESDIYVSRYGSPGLTLNLAAQENMYASDYSKILSAYFKEVEKNN